MEELHYSNTMLKAIEYHGYIFEIYYKNDVIEAFCINDSYGTKLFCIGLPVGENNETVASALEIALTDIVINGDLYIESYKELFEIYDTIDNEE